MMFSFLWHARAKCVRVLKPFVGAGLWLFFVTVVNAPQIPVGVQGVNTASLSGLSEKCCYCLLWAIKLVVCSFIQKKRDTGVQRECKMRSCFCYYHHVLAGKKCLSAPGLVERVTSFFLFNFSWESKCAPLFSFSRTLKTVVACGGCCGYKAGQDHEAECVLRRLRFCCSHTSVCCSPAAWDQNTVGCPRQWGDC